MEGMKTEKERHPSSAEIQSEDISQEVETGLAQSLREIIQLAKTEKGRKQIERDPIGSLVQITGIGNRQLLSAVYKGVKEGVGELTQGPDQEEALEPVSFSFGLPSLGGRTREEEVSRRLFLIVALTTVAGSTIAIVRKRSAFFGRAKEGVEATFFGKPELKQEEAIDEWVVGNHYKNYLAGRVTVSPLDVDNSRVRSLVGFSKYRKGCWFSDKLAPSRRQALEETLGRTFTDDELLEWRDNPELFLEHLEQMYQREEITRETIEFYRQPIDQIRSEFIEDYSPAETPTTGMPKVREHPRDFPSRFMERVKKSEEARRKDRLEKGKEKKKA